MSEKRSKKSKKEKVKKNEEKKSQEDALEIRSEKKSKEKNEKEEKSDTRKKTKEGKKAGKKAEKKALMEQVPKVDEDGIAYTKLQLRRMMKRIKRGLAPVPTEEEMREMKRQEAITKREEEDELAGLIYTEDDRVKTNDEESQDELDEDDADDQDDEGYHNHDDDGKEPRSAVAESNPRKRKKRMKPVPDDYVCQACQNKHEPAHWIYDCPNKVTVKGTNHIAKKLRGIHAPNDTKVFVSGLAFDMKKKDVEDLFRECGKVTSCKLLTFEDTGRCKGQAFITFETDASAKKAIQLSGTTVKNDEEKKKKSQKGDTKEEASKRKELRLKVTRRLSRAVTKGKTAS